MGIFTKGVKEVVKKQVSKTKPKNEEKTTQYI